MNPSPFGGLKTAGAASFAYAKEYEMNAATPTDPLHVVCPHCDATNRLPVQLPISPCKVSCVMISAPTGDAEEIAAFVNRPETRA